MLLSRNFDHILKYLTSGFHAARVWRHDPSECEGSPDHGSEAARRSLRTNNPGMESARACSKERAET